MADPRQALITHLGEIRKKLVACAIALGIGFGICYYFSEGLFQVLAQPLKKNLAVGETLVYTNLPDMFFVYIKTALVGGAAPLFPLPLLPGLVPHRAPSG